MKNIWEKVKIFILKKQADKQAKIRNDFLPEVLEIVEKPASPAGHVMISIITVIIIFFAVWAIFGRMDEVVTSRGQVMTVSGTQNIQSANIGIIEEICVLEGEYVEKGQPIVIIDSSIDELALQSVINELALLELENELLANILKGKNIEEFLDVEVNADRLKIVEYVLAIQKEYEIQKCELESAIEQAILQVSIEQTVLDKLNLNTEIYVEQKEDLNTIIDYSDSAQKNAEKLALELQYKEKELLNYQELYAAGAISKSEVDLLALEIDILKKEYESAGNQAICEEMDNSLQKEQIEDKVILDEQDNIAQENAVILAEQKHAQALKNLESLKASFEANVSALIVENETQINSLKTNLEAQEINVERQTLIAPIDGVVKTLEINTVGGVVTTGQTVATLVPDDSQMIVEVDIINQDIGCVQVGQNVVMKLDAFNFQEYGKLEGTIIFVSPDAVFSETKGWIYKAKVAIDDKAFLERNAGIEIGVGMECTAEIKVGERTIIEFFLEPVVEHFDGSLKLR